MFKPCKSHAALILILVSGCVGPKLPDLSLVTALMSPSLPAMRWDAREEAAEWTKSTLAVLEAKDALLAATVPADITQWCPGYEEASLADRRAFWAGLLSAIAKYESGWNPDAIGGGGRYVGLMQISQKSARHHGCEADDSAELKDGAANLSCAVTIIAEQVGRDALVAGEGNRGVARDWGPMQSQEKRSEMAAWTASQEYCR